VELSIATGPALERAAKATERVAPLAAIAGDLALDRAWTWRPLPNEELVVASGCAKGLGPPGRCGVVVGRLDGKAAHLLARFEDDSREVFDVAQGTEPRKIRARGLEARGSFFRELVYAYGRVDVGDAKH
jgi:hypothetical protein